MTIICKDCRKRFTSNFKFNEHKCPRLINIMKLNRDAKLRALEKKCNEPPEGNDAA